MTQKAASQQKPPVFDELSLVHSDEVQDIQKMKSKQSILILTWEFPPNIIGGLARHCYGLAKSLVKEDCEIHVVTTKLHNTPSTENVEGINVYRITPLHEQEPNFLTWIGGLNLAMIEKVKQLSINNQFSIIHAHDWLVGTSALMLKEELKVPLIATIHSLEHGRNNGIYTDTQRFINEKERQLINGADQLIVCSEYMREELHQVFAVKKEDIAVIANGIDQDVSVTNEVESLDYLPINPNKRLVFSIGRLVKEKGFETIIEAVPDLLKKNPDLYFIIAGKGPMLSEYERMIADNGLENDVFLVGYVGDAERNKLFDQCELAIFPSLYEPFGIVSLESMIFGKPTIVSKTGGLKGIIKHMKTGLFMNPGDKDSLVEQVQFLLDNKQFADKLGGNGRQIVQRLFSWQRIGSETKRVYEESRYKYKYFQK
ncbi:glycosyltransferase family 4 protein [Neobacillus sp. LXY-4]|uniref:glycosyltransferase family 4 protein n=1 Tax=Neobacillus sp. LXY-4 TaxID=3379826 RepID=UPI003EDF5108